MKISSSRGYVLFEPWLDGSSSTKTTWRAMSFGEKLVPRVSALILTMAWCVTHLHSLKNIADGSFSLQIHSWNAFATISLTLALTLDHMGHTPSEGEGANFLQWYCGGQSETYVHGLDGLTTLTTLVPYSSTYSHGLTAQVLIVKIISTQTGHVGTHVENVGGPVGVHEMSHWYEDWAWIWVYQDSPYKYYFLSSSLLHFSRDFATATISSCFMVHLQSAHTHSISNELSQNLTWKNFCWWTHFCLNEALHMQDADVPSSRLCMRSLRRKVGEED